MEKGQVLETLGSWRTQLSGKCVGRSGTEEVFKIEKGGLAYVGELRRQRQKQAYFMLCSRPVLQQT